MKTDTGAIIALEKGNMSEKKATDKIIDDHAWIAWLDWYKDIPAHQIPVMTEQWRRAFRAGARWMESVKGGE